MKENYLNQPSCVMTFESLVKENWSEDIELECLLFNRFADKTEASEREKESNKNQPNNK